MDTTYTVQSRRPCGGHDGGTPITTLGADDAAEVQLGLLRALLNLARNGIVAVDGDGRIVFTNAGAEELFHYGPHELLGQRFEMLVPDAAGAVAPGPPALAVPAAVSELPGRRKDGSTFRARISLSSIEVDGRRLTAVAVDDSAAPTEHRAYGGDGVIQDFDKLLAVILRLATFVREQLTAPVDHPTGERRDHVRGDVDEILLATGRASVLSHQLLALGCAARRGSSAELSGQLNP